MSLHRFLRCTFPLAAILALGWAVLPGCGTQDSGSPPPLTVTPPAPGTPPPDTPPPAGQPRVTLSNPSPATITAGSTGSAVKVTVLDANGNAVANTTVTFTVSPTSVASIAGSATASTDAAGEATVTVLGIRAGTASVTARALSVTSAATTLTVVAPSITLAPPQPANIAVSLSGGGGSAITATVKDQDGNLMPGQDVTFTTSLGELTPVTSPSDGAYQVTLTSKQLGTAVVTAEVRGARSDSVTVTVGPGALSELTVTPSPNKISPNGSSTIAIQAKDGLGNPVNAKVDLQTNLGTLSAASVTLVNGQGTVILSAGPADLGTARVTAQAGTVTKTTDVVFAIDLTGEPAVITVEVKPGPIIDVAGVGGVETATLTATVTDSTGGAIIDVSSNVEFAIIDGPQGGERLIGGTDPNLLTLSSAGGKATATFQSGTLPGTVNVELRVTKRKNGDPLAPPLKVGFPKLTIKAGPPFGLFLGRSNAISQSGGLITHEYFAVLSDRYGNNVTDGTSVSFRQIFNILAEGTAGATTAGTSTFSQSDPGVSFLNPQRRVSTGDTLIIYDDQSAQRGGYIVASDPTTANSLTVHSTFSQSEPTPPETELRWAVGNNRGGGVLVPPTGGEVTTVDGVARWPNTYPGELINSPVYIFAETSGRKLGDARPFSLAWLAPTKIEPLGFPDQLAAGVGSTVAVDVTVTDSSTPTAYPIPNLPVTVTATVGTVTDGVTVDTKLQLVTSPRISELGQVGGETGLVWSIPALPPAGTATLYISAGGTLSKTTLTAK